MPEELLEKYPFGKHENWVFPKTKKPSEENLKAFAAPPLGLEPRTP